MAPTALVPFQRRVLDDLLDEDALCVVARGLGLNRILAEVAQICATSRVLVFLLNMTDEDEAELQGYLMQMRSGENSDEAATLHIINNETNAAMRGHVYRKGGLISVTSRILIVDLLNSVVPVELVSGVIIHNASRVTAESIEAFVVRILQQQNRDAFVQALSDAPEAFTAGFAPLEKTLKVLGIRHVNLWPRFHVEVQRDLSKAAVPVVELRQGQTKAMVEQQQAVLDCLSAMISELASTTKLLDPETINVENSLFRYFDAMVKRQLSAYWHRLSARARGMVSDLSLLRRVAELITSYDPVSLLEYLDTLLLAAKPSPGGAPGPAASWMGTDSANILYAATRARAFRKTTAEQIPPHTREALRGLGLPDNIIPVLEVPPKLELLGKILEEIGVANRAAETKGTVAGPILVMAGSAKECRMIRGFLASLHQHVTLDFWQRGERSSETRTIKTERYPRVMIDMLRGFFRRKAQTGGIRPGAPANQPTSNSMQQRRHAPPAKRRRVRGASATAGARSPRAAADILEQETSDLALQAEAMLDDTLCVDDGYLDDGRVDAPGEFDANFGLLAPQESVVVDWYGGTRGVLQTHRPTQVVMYTPDTAFVRQVELYQASGAELRQVYFLVYDNSLEEQRYLSAIRREREAFERLVRDKAGLVIPLNDVTGVVESPASMLLRAVAARSQRDARDTTETQTPQQQRVVVDIREMRAPLPSLLHAGGFSVVPRTLVVGDYVLHDGLAMERKSLPDLIGSLRSGRLFSQAEAMVRHYACAVLLVEFEVNTSFSLQAIGGLGPDISIGSITSQLAMLVLAFPRLRIVWSCSPYETVQIFSELKRRVPEPDIEKAVAAGQEDDDADHEALYTQGPIALLQSLPGVTQKNYQMLARGFRNISALCDASKADLEQLLGAEAASQLHSFLHTKATQ
ncbi:DNA repair protein RAD16 [Coemansia sp. RSA 988]|nr:DNA repair protein RAD16 [Coemansia sp. RSA 988]